MNKTQKEKEKIPFKLLSDIGNSLVTCNYSLVYSDSDKRWNTTELAEDITNLIDEIIEGERHLSQIEVNSENWVHDLGIELIAKINKADDMPDSYYISQLANELSDLLIARSNASEKSVKDTVIDVTELIFKIKDFLNVTQLAKKQHYKKVKKVIVFAETPIEFDSIASHQKKYQALRDQIKDNLRNGVEYWYYTSKDFPIRRIQSFLRTEPDRIDLLERIKVVKINPQHFKTFYTLHYHPHSDSPNEIYMSALLKDRDDLLIQISDPSHFQRIVDRIDNIIPAADKKIKDIKDKSNEDGIEVIHINI